MYIYIQDIMCSTGNLAPFRINFFYRNSRPSGIHSDIKEGFADHHITSGSPRLCLAVKIFSTKSGNIDFSKYFMWYTQCHKAILWVIKIIPKW